MNEPGKDEKCKFSFLEKFMNKYYLLNELREDFQRIIIAVVCDTIDTPLGKMMSVNWSRRALSMYAVARPAFSIISH